MCLDAVRVAALIEKHAARLGITPSRASAATPVTATQPDALWCRTTTRFLDPAQQPAPEGHAYHYPPYRKALTFVPPPDHSSKLRSSAPVVAWEPLSPGQCQALLPPASQSSTGARYALSQAALLPLLFQLRPPTHYNTPTPSSFVVEACEARVTRAQDGNLQVAFWGSAHGDDPWYPLEGPATSYGFATHVAWSSFAGYFEVSGPAQRITRLKASTSWGLLGGSDGTLLPFLGVIEAEASAPQAATGDGAAPSS